MTRRSRVRRLLAAALAILTMAALSGCAAHQERTAATRPLITVLVHEPTGADATAGIVEARKAWDELAKAYHQQKGVRVDVQVATSKAYPSALRTAMASPIPPTLFLLDGTAGAQRWQDYLADVGRTAAYSHLDNRQLALRRGNAVVAVPAGVKSYGLAYRSDILSHYFSLLAQNKQKDGDSQKGDDSSAQNKGTTGKAADTPSIGASSGQSSNNASSNKTATGNNSSDNSSEKSDSTPITSLEQVNSVQSLQALLFGVQAHRRDLGINQALASGIFSDGQTGHNGGWGTVQLADLALGCTLGKVNSSSIVRSLDGIDPHRQEEDSQKKSGSSSSQSADSTQKKGSSAASDQNGSTANHATRQQILASGCVNGLRPLIDDFARVGGNRTQSSAQALDAFASGKAAFLPIQTGAWPALSKAFGKSGASSVGFLPAYFSSAQASVDADNAGNAHPSNNAESSDNAHSAGNADKPHATGNTDPHKKEAGFLSGADTYWAINTQASRIDQNATASFLDWIVTSSAGGRFASKLGLWLPYSVSGKRSTSRSSHLTGSQPLQTAVEKWWKGAADRHQPNPDLMFKHQLAPTHEWRTQVSSALNYYAASPSDLTWKTVTTAFIDNWRSQYLASEQ